MDQLFGEKVAHMVPVTRCRLVYERHNRQHGSNIARPGSAYPSRSQFGPTNPKNADGIRYIFEVARAKVFNVSVKSGGELIMSFSGDDNFARISKRQQPGGDVYSMAINIVGPSHNLSVIYTDSELQT